MYLKWFTTYVYVLLVRPRLYSSIKSCHRPGLPDTILPDFVISGRQEKFLAGIPNLAFLNPYLVSMSFLTPFPAKLPNSIIFFLQKSFFIRHFGSLRTFCSLRLKRGLEWHLELFKIGPYIWLKIWHYFCRFLRLLIWQDFSVDLAFFVPCHAI